MLKLLGVALCLLVLLGWAVAAYQAHQNQYQVPAAKVPLAVLGDSDSHSYQDTVSFPANSDKRGGTFRASTYQWTELLDQLRGRELSLGQWGVWGTNGKLARLMDVLGLGGRSPQKMDFQFNFAQSGAECQALTQGRMAQRLISLMDQQSQAWEQGIVVIRIGVNDLGTEEILDQMAKGLDTDLIRERMSFCSQQVQKALTLLHKYHPKTHVVLVGLFNNANWARLINRWSTTSEQGCVSQMVEQYNALLRAMVRPGQISYFDDAKWFEAQWGSRTPDGKPDYKTVTVMNGWPTTNSVGDHPSNATVVDGHAGTIWNLKWAQALIDHINANTSIKLSKLSDDELAQFLVAHDIPNWAIAH